MEVTADLIQYDMLKNRSAEEILLEVFEDDDMTDHIFIRSGYQLPGGWSDSALIFGAVADCCVKLMQGKIEPVNQLRLFCGFARLFVYQYMPDELGLRNIPEENYISSFSERVADEIHFHLNEACQALLVASLVDSGFDGNEETANAYLNQWKVLIEEAVQERLGILIHMG